MDVVTSGDRVVALTVAVIAWAILVALGTVCGALVIQMIKDLYHRREP